ncbi:MULTISPECIES: hypothetical protein [Enterococcus]|uniref:hypothetical protein n=1 Tax=Enterococcus TaxID=1350 RepID=UPI000D34007A|nr:MULTISPECIES: hypothetical protein [Enterococcus]MBO1086800.1 hypothetical protein [Enterococcus mundtii]MDV7744118.1 hypothetical protein [Enterococcus mundtii]NBA62850.1 hypothetical protein [Enterococcus mundtii]PTO39922.1 hypothetical protein C6P52_02895 [Enterococcus mundtii]PTO42536.1 hypothetical protein C6P50_03300 [Enterococcus mundtii]
MTNNQFRLLIAMFFSICCFVGGIVYGDSPQSVLLFFIMTFPGLAGFYYSMKANLGRYKWMIVSLNYFFATFIIIGQFIQLIVLTLNKK